MSSNTSDFAAIQDLLNDEANYWNKGDAEGFSKHFAPKGTFTNIVGMFAIGYNAFLERHRQILTAIFQNTTLRQEITSMQWIGADVVIVETFIEVTGCQTGKLPGIYIDDDGVLRTRLLQVLRRYADGWKIVAYHNVDIKKGIPVPECESGH